MYLILAGSNGHSARWPRHRRLATRILPRQPIPGATPIGAQPPTTPPRRPRYYRSYCPNMLIAQPSLQMHARPEEVAPC
jgi:hypothetical protein